MVATDQTYSRTPTFNVHSNASPDEDDDLGNDCCAISNDPLIYGPGRGSCILATAMLVIFILMVLAGTLATLIHYTAGIEFDTYNRGRVVGPLLLGLSTIPLLCVCLCMWQARSRVAAYVEQQKFAHAAEERATYRQYQARLAREPGQYSQMAYSGHRQHFG
ncbi:unnamed protein product [Dicrocoelium dendriticum]|nr:unnamed protein product [Dicrocoelium dendriticum]